MCDERENFKSNLIRFFYYCLLKHFPEWSFKGIIHTYLIVCLYRGYWKEKRRENQMSHKKKKVLIELEKSQGFESGVVSAEDVWAEF